MQFDEVLTNTRPEFVSVPVSVSGWCIWTPGAAEMMMAWSPGVIDIILRGSSKSIEQGGATYNCSRGGSGFLETWRGERIIARRYTRHTLYCLSVRSHSLLTPQLARLWQFINKLYNVFNYCDGICSCGKLGIKCFHTICQGTIICWQLDVFHIPQVLDKKGVTSDIIATLSQLQLIQ